MPIRPYEDTIVDLTPSDDKVHHILPEFQRTRSDCPHGVEFWVTIRTVSRDNEPLILQWCMSCRQVDVLRQEEYDWRARLEEMRTDDVPDRLDRPEELRTDDVPDRPDRPDHPDRLDRAEPDLA